jgi:hypothetical protein
MVRWTLRNRVNKFERGWHKAAAALVGGVVLAAPAAASAQPAVGVTTLSAGRIVALVAVAVGLFGAVIGGRALARSAGRAGDARRGAITALVLAPTGLAVGGFVVATAEGGVGTGHGLGGGVVAIVVGLIGMALGGLALARSRRAG